MQKERLFLRLISDIKADYAKSLRSKGEMTFLLAVKEPGKRQSEHVYNVANAISDAKEKLYMRLLLCGTEKAVG